jgi:hypothetical protein
MRLDSSVNRQTANVYWSELTCVVHLKAKLRFVPALTDFPLLISVNLCSASESKACNYPDRFYWSASLFSFLVYVSKLKSISCSLVKQRRHHGKMSNMQTRVKFQFIVKARIIMTVNSHLSHFVTFQPNDVFSWNVLWNAHVSRTNLLRSSNNSAI